MHFLRSLFLFYYDGLRNMTSFGKSLWKLIILKAIILVIIAYFLFPDILEEKFTTDKERADHVGSNILQTHTK